MGWWLLISKVCAKLILAIDCDINYKAIDSFFVVNAIKYIQDFD